MKNIKSFGEFLKESIGSKEIVRGEFKSYEEFMDFVDQYSEEFTDCLWDIMPYSSGYGPVKTPSEMPKQYFDAHLNRNDVFGVIITEDNMYGYFRKGDVIRDCYEKNNKQCDPSVVKKYLY